MPRRNVIILRRSKVHTYACDFLLSEENFPELLQLLQKKYKELKHIDNIPDFFSKFGWTVRVSFRGITKMIYNSERWEYSSYWFLKRIASFVKEGSYIQIQDLTNSISWLYRFHNHEVERVELLEWQIDRSSNQDLLEVVEAASRQLFLNGYSRTELVNLIDELYIERLL